MELPSKTTILFLDHTSQLGGAERSMLDLLSRLDRSRVEPIVATTPGGPLVERLRALGIEVFSMGLSESAQTLSREQWEGDRWRFLWMARAYFAQALDLCRFVRRRRIAALHTNTLKAHVLGTLVAFLTRRKILWHMRDLPSSRGDSRSLFAKLHGLVRPGVLAISRAVADDLPPPLARSARVVYNGIDLEAFDAKLAQKAEPLPLPAGDGPLIGTVSYLIPWKGQEVFLRAAAKLLAEHPDWRFLVVGEPIFQFKDERRRLEALAGELGLGESLVFAGHREDIPSVMAALDLFVLPSLYEPFGRVLLEAMAARRAIVASDAGGVPEIVLDQQTGLLVPPGDAEALAGAIARVVSDPSLSARLGQAARARAEALFSLDATVRGVMEAYEAMGLLRVSK